MKKDRNYVNGPRLHEALKDWYASGKQEPPKIIVDAIMQICERLATRENFKNYTYIDEMIGEGQLACIAAVVNKKYNPERSNNPFAYFTKIAWNEFIRIIKVEHKEVYIKHMALQNHIIDAEARGEVLDYTLDDSGRLDSLIEKFQGTTTDDDE